MCVCVCVHSLRFPGRQLKSVNDSFIQKIVFKSLCINDVGESSRIQSSSR